MTEITISEYGYIGCDNLSTNDSKFVGNRSLSKKEFKELQSYWNKDKNTQKIFTFESKECLKATSYVGIIQTQHLSIEILPKIFNGEKKKKNRNIFIEMIKPLLGINEIQINKADLSTTKNKNIYEMFISMFVEYLDELIHKGLKSSYISKEDNQFFLKGKLKFNQHIKQNYIRKERFYVEFDEYMKDRVENRLLKSTIELLLKKTNNYDNKRALRQQLFIFDEVNISKNYDIDISKINLHRGMEYYEMPLRFAKVFLKHQSFTSLRGKDNVFAVLFPMETVFEKYMEFVLNNSKDKLGIDKVRVNGKGYKDKNHWLLSDVEDGNCNMANLQPDYLLEMKSGNNIITDAKWKLFDVKENEDGSCSKVNISSGDVYQIFSYLHYYDDIDETAYLFVPNTDTTRTITLKYNTQGSKMIKIIPIDLDLVIDNNHMMTENAKTIINCKEET